MKYFLAKTDPDTFSIDDFNKEKDKITTWDGVHNFQAINVMKTWLPGDFVLIYHSMGEASIRGLAVVLTNPIKNENDPRPSVISDLKLLKIYPKDGAINLKQIKATGLFSDFSTCRQSRLSTLECTDEFISWLLMQDSEYFLV